MKQTNNAIKFLMAQYRAIFKQAYIKGLASAVILTAGLAVAGTANATAPSAITGDVIVLDTNKIKVGGKEYTLPSDIAGIVIGKDDNGYFGISFKDEMNLTIKDANFNIVSEDHAGYGSRIAFDSGSYDFSGTNHLGQIVTIDSNGTGTTTFTNTSGDGATINIDGRLTVSRDTSESSAAYNGSGGDAVFNATAVDIVIGKGKEGDEPIAGSLIIDPNIYVGNLTLDGDSIIQLYRDIRGKNGDTPAESLDEYNDNFSKNKTIFIAKDKTVTFAGNNTITASDAALQDPKEEFSLTFAASGTNSASVKVNEGASLTVERDLYLGKGITFNNSGSVVNNAAINIGLKTEVETGKSSATANVSGKATFTVASGASLTNNTGAEINVVSGSFTIAKGAKFTNNGTLTLAADTSGSFDVSVVKSVKDLGGSGFKNNGAAITLTASGNDTYGTFTVKNLDDLKPTTGDLNLTINGGVTVYSQEDLKLSSGNFSATKLHGADTASKKAILSSDNVTYTTVADGENLNSVTVFGKNLTFVKHTDPDKKETPTSVSGSAASTFAAYNVRTKDGSAITLGQNITLDMSKQRDESTTKGNIDVDLTLHGAKANTKLNIQDLDVSAKNITLASGDILVKSDKALTKLTVDTLDITGKDNSSGSVTVNGDQAELAVNTFKSAGATLTVENGATFSVLGDGNNEGKTETLDLNNGDKISITSGILNLNKAADTINLKLSASGDWAANTGYAKVGATNSTVNIDLTGVSGNTGTISVATANKLLGTLVANTNGNLVNITGADIDIPVQDDGTVKAEDIKDANGNISVNFEHEKTKNNVLTGVEAGKTVTGGWKGVTTAGTDNDVNVAANGQLAVYGTVSGENIAVDSKGNLIGVTLAEGSVLAVKTTGTIGDITGGKGELQLSADTNLTVGQNGIVNVQDIKGNGGSVKAESIEAKNVELAGATVSGDSLTLKTDGTFSAENTKFTIADELDLTALDTNEVASVKNSVVAAKTINAAGKEVSLENSAVSGDKMTAGTVDVAGGNVDISVIDVNNMTVSDDATVITDSIKLTGPTGILAVGTEDNAAAGTKSSSAVLQVKSLTLNGGSLVVDPAYTENTALVTVNTFGTVTGSSDDVGTADGNLYVGQNSALGLGLEETAELQGIIGRYQSNGALDPKKYGAVLYVDGKLNVASGKGITLTSMTQSAFKDHTKYSSLVTADQIFFGANTALIVNGENLKSGEAFITMEGSSAKTLLADGGHLIINGDIKTGSYKIFGSSGSMSIKDLEGDTAEKDGAVIIVKSENNLLTGKLTNASGTTTTDGVVKLDVNIDEAATILNAASRPVYDTIIAYGNGYNGEKLDTDGKDTATEFKPASNQLYGLDAKGNPVKAYSNYFLQEELTKGNGSSTEAVSRLGAYGGAAQAALAAGSATYEAVAGRMGMGAAAGNITFADNGQGAGLWLAPVYKNRDSNGFGAQGVNYGVDMDLFGLALGGDFTMANGLRLGAALNVGSGDADGNGAAAGVSNDFDYVGFTVYGGYTVGQLSVVGDVSYTTVDNDLSANTAIENVKASADSTALSVGVTGQYAFDFNGVSLTPHAGLRFTNVDLDDYTVKGSGKIADFKGDSFNVFSIPVGVTVSKDIVAGAWTVKPAFDFTLTANMGDDEIDGSVKWDGVENLKTVTSTEVLDSFTYGATLGVSAKTGNFAVGFGLNYTGSSNTDELGVNANARFVF